MAYIGKSFVAEALRSQATAEEKQKSLSKMFAADTASRLSQIVAQQMQRGGARRGKEAASRGAGASAMNQIEYGKSRLELQKDISQQAQISNWITTASSAVGSIIAFSATQADDAAKKEAEAAAVEEAKNTEQAAMLTDYRKAGEEYSPSMLRDPGAVGADDSFPQGGQVFDPEGSSDGYFPQGGQIPQGYRGTGMTATEFKAMRDAERAKQATESLILDKKQDDAIASSREFTEKQKLLDSQRMGRRRSPTAEELYGKENMTDEETALLDERWANYILGGAE
tara:strand:- start:65 stop:913 length:849 start_codon:yes stop_codon:yes gene_type:complete